MTYNPDGVTDSWAAQAMGNIWDSISNGLPVDPYDLVRSSWSAEGPGMVQDMLKSGLTYKQAIQALAAQEAMNQDRLQSEDYRANLQGQYGLAGEGMKQATERWKLPQTLQANRDVANIQANAQGKVEAAKLAAQGKQFASEQERLGRESQSKLNDPLIAMFQQALTQRYEKDPGSRISEMIKMIDALKHGGNYQMPEKPARPTWQDWKNWLWGGFFNNNQGSGGAPDQNPFDSADYNSEAARYQNMP